VQMSWQRNDDGKDMRELTTTLGVPMKEDKQAAVSCDSKHALIDLKERISIALLLLEQ